MEALPCVFVLMPGKQASTEVYTKLLQFLIKKAEEVEVDLSNCDWDILADFEKGERKAFEKSFENCAVYGCGFYYTQALMKNVSELGLAKPSK